MAAPVTHLFVDLGGVLLTNGWDRHLREATAEHFEIDPREMDERHHLTYDTYESGKMGLDTYLDRIVFYQPRPFSRQDVIDFILAAGKPFQEMIDLVCAIKDRHGIKVAVLSNEGREIAVDRIQRFQLARFVDFFIVSCFVHFRKPDEDIFRVALDVAQATPDGTVYLEDRQLFAEVGGRFGLRAIWHRNVDSTRETLAGMGLTV